MRRARRRALLACLALLAACGDASLSERLDLTGTVSDAESGRGIAGAQVTFVSDTGQRRETTSGGGGGYGLALFSDTPFGQLRVEAEGFQARETTVFFDTPLRVVDVALRRRVE